MSKISLNIFRTYDVRGIYPQELNEDVVFRLAAAYTELYPFSRKIVVAQDTRKSSPSLAKTIINSLVRRGKEVINIGIAPDPLFYFSIFHYKFDGGIMISGSHNPKEYNGLTFHIRKPGKKMSEDVIGEELEKIKNMAIEGKDFPASVKGKITIFEPTEKYIDYITKKVSLTRKLKIVIDSGNGACGYLPEKVFKKLGCKAETIHGDFDGNFPHHLPDPYEEENLKDIKKTVKEKRADLGFAYDADGDRVALIDSRGRVISGDDCLFLFAKDVLKKKKGPIVHDMRVSKSLLDAMKKENVKTYFCTSHHNAIIDKIIETGAVFGGEITLHFLFPLDYYLCDEAIFASLKMAEIVSGFKDFSSYIDILPHYHSSKEIFIDSTDEEKFKIINNLKKYLRSHKYNFIDIDGARINFKHGWALARAANTTPIIKCRFEGDTKEHLVEIEKEALYLFKKVGIPITEKVYQELNLLYIS